MHYMFSYVFLSASAFAQTTSRAGNTDFSSQGDLGSYVGVWRKANLELRRFMLPKIDSIKTNKSFAITSDVVNEFDYDLSGGMGCFVRQAIETSGRLKSLVSRKA